MQFGPGFSATFLYYFASVSLLFTVVTVQGMGIGYETGIPQGVGVVTGLLAGLVGAYFNRTIVKVIPLQGKKKMLATLESTLTQMGYQQVSEAENTKIYERSGFSKWLSGKVFVQVDPKQLDQLTIASRAVQIRQIRKQLL
jgi:hypothetical protein